MVAIVTLALNGTVGIVWLLSYTHADVCSAAINFSSFSTNLGIVQLALARPEEDVYQTLKTVEYLLDGQ